MSKYITTTAVHTIPFLSLGVATLAPSWATAAQAALTILLYLVWSRDFIARIEGALQRDVEPVRSDLANAQTELTLIEPMTRRIEEEQSTIRARLSELAQNTEAEAVRIVGALTGRKRRTGALPEEKERAIVAQRIAGKKIAALAEDYGVDERTIQRILARYRLE